MKKELSLFNIDLFYKSGKIRIIFLVISLFLMSFLVFYAFNVFANTTVAPSSFSVNEDVSVFYNVTINNTATTNNITQVNVTLPIGFTYTGSTASASRTATFTNTSTILSWINDTGGSYFILNQTLQYVWFNASAVTPGNYNFTIVTLYNSGGTNTTNISVTVNSTTSFSVAQNIVYLNRTENTPINLSITAPSGTNTNITVVAIALVQGESRLSFVSGSNRTTAIEASGFTNTSSLLIWNTSTTGFPQQSTRNFLFNVTADTAGTATLAVNVTRADGASQQLIQTFVVNFAFSGYVKNETGSNVSGANVTIYQFIEGVGGPPSEIAVRSVLSDSNGSFTLVSINGSNQLYTFKMVYRNASDGGNANKVGSVLPPFPSMLYYPMSVPPGTPEFMKPPTLNGTTFYLDGAVTLRLNVTNESTGQRFGYIVMDQTTGFPVSSNLRAALDTQDVVVPVGRSYTVMFMREYTQFPYAASCDGSFMNNTACPSPPVSNSTLGTLTAGGVVQVIQNLRVSRVNLLGCITIAAGHNNSLFNITSIIPKFVPWTGFLPPGSSDTSSVNLTSDLSNNFTKYPECNGTFAFYNLSLISSASGIGYMLEFYAKNASNETGNPGNANTLAAFQNVTMINATNPGRVNVTLYRLTGSYWTGGLGSVNTSTMRVNIQNSTGGAITTGMHVDLQVKNPIFGTFTYIIETLVNGTFYLPVLNTSNWVKVKIFADDSPPKELTLNLSRAENNITLTTMTSGDAGFERINATGGREQFNISSMPIRMRFLRNSATCNVIDPPSSCEITSMSATDFNPFKALVAGKINMEMKITSTNTTLMFMNFDMFSAKQPPMESILNDNATGSSGATLDWQFGSFVPADVYEYVLVGMPYSDSAVNDSAPINLSIPLFYDENWQVVWNVSRGDTSANMSDEFIDYNVTLYRNFTRSGGIECTKTDGNLNVTPCFVNTSTNFVWQRIPHFSGEGPRIIGSAPASGGSGTSGTTGGGGGTATGGKTYSISNSQLSTGYTQTLVKNDKVKFYVGVVEHSVTVTQVGASSVSISVASHPQSATLAIGASKKFDVDDDNVDYDVQVTINSATGTNASVTLKGISETISSAPEQSVQEPSQPSLPSVPSEETPTGGTGTGLVTEEIEKGSRVWMWLVVAVAIIVIIAWFIVFIANKKK